MTTPDEARKSAPCPESATSAEHHVLEAMCATFLPALDPEAGDHPGLFALQASDLDLGRRVDQHLLELFPEQRRDLYRLLRAMNSGWRHGLLTGFWQAFPTLSLADRSRALERLARSWWPGLRTAFQAVKRLAHLLFYSTLNPSGSNPTWPGIGYTPSPNGPAAPAMLRLTRIEEASTLECDVCVVGSGAGGCVVASELARAGLHVVVLEAGGGWQNPDFDQREAIGLERLYLDRGCTTTRDLGISILAGQGLGGGTTINWQTCLRLPMGIRQEWAERSRCEWLLGEPFSRSMDAVATRLGVNTRITDINENNSRLQRGCWEMGWARASLPRNAHGCDPAQCGYCVFGCRQGGKQSAAVTFLGDGQREGKLVIIPDCRAQRVVLRGSRVHGVEALATGNAAVVHPVRVLARRVVVAAGALQSPALLLRSGLQLPALGKHLYLHPTSLVLGFYDDPIEGWRGPPHSILCEEFAELEGNFGFRLEAAPVHPGIFAAAIPWTDARTHRRWMQRLRHLSVIIVLTRDVNPGRVRLDRSGRALIDYQLGQSERRLLAQGIAAAARVHLAAGASEVVTLHTRPSIYPRGSSRSPQAMDAFCHGLLSRPVHGNHCGLFSAHQMGTCRLGWDRRTAVCDTQGQVLGVEGLFVGDASLFPCSSGVNPMLTIMALAHFLAQGLKASPT